MKEGEQVLHADLEDVCLGMDSAEPTLLRALLRLRNTVHFWEGNGIPPLLRRSPKRLSSSRKEPTTFYSPRRWRCPRLPCRGRRDPSAYSWASRSWLRCSQ